MYNAKQTKTIIYRSINKNIVKDSLYSTWVFANLEKKRLEVIKSFEILLKCKMAPRTDQGGKKEKQQHVSWFPVFSVFLVNAASLFILAQTWVKSQTVRHNDTYTSPTSTLGQEIQSRTMLTFLKSTRTLKPRWS